MIDKLGEVFLEVCQKEKEREYRHVSHPLTILTIPTTPTLTHTLNSRNNTMQLPRHRPITAQTQLTELEGSMRTSQYQRRLVGVVTSKLHPLNRLPMRMFP